MDMTKAYSVFKDFLEGMTKSHKAQSPAREELRDRAVMEFKAGVSSLYQSREGIPWFAALGLPEETPSVEAEANMLEMAAHALIDNLALQVGAENYKHGHAILPPSIPLGGVAFVTATGLLMECNLTDEAMEHILSQRQSVAPPELEIVQPPLALLLRVALPGLKPNATPQDVAEYLWEAAAEWQQRQS